MSLVLRPIEYKEKMQRDREAIQLTGSVLMDRFKYLSTFAHVEAWDREAQEFARKLQGLLRGLGAETDRCQKALMNIEDERESKPLVLRFFHARREQGDYQKIIQLCNEHGSAIESVVAELQEAIDFSPNSQDEQKTLLAELDLRKKELQFAKREIAANMKAVRAEARQQSATAGRYGIFYSSKSASYERRQIRYAKESILRPQEDEKSAIERQLLQVDRDIAWVKRFRRG